MNRLLNIVRIIVSIILCIILIVLFLNLANVTTQLFLTPFLLAALATLGLSISIYKENDLLIVFFQKCYIISFLLYWFGLLILGCYTALKDKQMGMLLFSIPFWIAGIFIIKKYFFDKK